MNYRELHRLYELDGSQATVEHVGAALQSGELQPADFSLRELAEAVVPDGREWVRSLDPRGGYEVTEADGVDLTAFANISGQIVYTRLLAAYNSPAFALSRLIDTIPTKFDGEKIAGMQPLDPDAVGTVAPGMPYPHAGFGERYIETPSTTKRGFIVPVTKEAIFFDRTHMVLKNAAEVGEALGVNKEKRIAQLIAGIINNYKENGSSFNTYQTAAPWINSAAGGDLIDWTDIDELEQMFSDMLDPTTGEPIVINPENMTLLTMPARNHAARRILNATEIQVGDGAANSTATKAANTVSQYGHVSSRFLYRALIASGVTAVNAAKYHFLGDFKKAFAYMENWPITVTRAPTNSEAEFNADIVARFKASERGVAAVLDPRFVARKIN